MQSVLPAAERALGLQLRADEGGGNRWALELGSAGISAKLQDLHAPFGFHQICEF